MKIKSEFLQKLGILVIKTQRLHNDLENNNFYNLEEEVSDIVSYVLDLLKVYRKLNKQDQYLFSDRWNNVKNEALELCEICNHLDKDASSCVKNMLNNINPKITKKKYKNLEDPYEKYNGKYSPPPKRLDDDDIDDIDEDSDLKD